MMQISRSVLSFQTWLYTEKQLRLIYNNGIYYYSYICYLSKFYRTKECILVEMPYQTFVSLKTI